MASVGGDGKRAATMHVGIVGLGGGASDMIPASRSTLTSHSPPPPISTTGQLETFQREFQGETYLSAEALCTNPQVDVVYIATPNQFHTAHALLALRAGQTRPGREADDPHPGQRRTS